jgi:hypothetical protein
MQTYSITFNMQLTPGEVASLYQTKSDDASLVEPSHNRETRQKVLTLLGRPDNKRVVIEKMRPVNIDRRIKKRKHLRLTHTERHAPKIELRHRRLADVLHKPNYTFARYHQGVDRSGLAMWLNRKEKQQYHFRTDTWPVRGACDASRTTLSEQWRAANPERAQIEQFKASLDARYPGLMTNARCFFQHSCYKSLVDYSRLLLLVRPRDEDNARLYPEGRRFPEKMLAKFAKTCLQHDLRVVLGPDQIYRRKQSRFILIADTNVDLAQAWQFVLSLPVDK